MNHLKNKIHDTNEYDIFNKNYKLKIIFAKTNRLSEGLQIFYIN